MNSYRTNLNLKNTDIGLLIFRVSISVLMLTHGFPKLLRFFGPEEINFVDPFGLGQTITFGLAVFAEFVCAVFVLFGFLTRFSAIPIVLTMAVAAFIIHATDGFGKQELPIAYMFSFLFFVFSGAGKYSIDFLIQNKK